MPTASKVSAVLLTALAIGGPARAFDCGKAATNVEKAICANPKLKANDDAMSAAYDEISSLSTDAERRMLAHAQKRWIAQREQDCGASQGDELASCIAGQISERIKAFTVTSETGPGPASRLIPVFVQQDGAKGVYEVDYSLIRFATPKSSAEARFNEEINKIIGMAPLGPQSDLADREYLDSFASVTLSYASPRLMSALYDFGSDGGAHPNGGVSNFNFDIGTGSEIEVDDVLSEDAAAKLAKQCREQIIAQKRDNAYGEPYDPANDDFFLKDDIIAEHIATMSRWTFRDYEAVVTFDAYAIGSYVEGSFECHFPMPELKALALPTAPLP